jgi:hypothetical protein
VRFENKNIFFYFQENASPSKYNTGVVVVNSGSNPKTVSFNASVVKIYNATNSIARFYHEKYLSSL